MTAQKNAASFRDPSGFVFSEGDTVYRQVNKRYQREIEHLEQSGLYKALVKQDLLIPHSDASDQPCLTTDGFKVIRPEPIPFISYPYEWSFSQLKDAALATLDVQRLALDHGMILKDASAYNIQFHNGRAVFIDTLSFDFYEEGMVWQGYRQFCQHFLAPLALMAYHDPRLIKLMRAFIDGIPLDMASSALPFRTRFRLGLLTHIHLHAASQKKHSDDAATEQVEKIAAKKLSRTALLGLLDNLRATTTRLNWTPQGSEWGDYYQDTNYSDASAADKDRIIRDFAEGLSPAAVWDVGANTGRYSRIFSNQDVFTVAFDIDEAAVEKNYLHVRENKEKHILPLVLDLTNPSPGIGWRNQERDTMTARGPVDLCMALALIHHLAISNNLPLESIAGFFAGFCRHLVIEFVPKEDSQVRRLLATREDIFPTYTQAGFEEAFSEFFEILKTEFVKESERTLYLMRAR